MGGAWSSWGAPAAAPPAVESVRADPSDQAPFVSPLTLTVTLARAPPAARRAVWSVALEVDVAHAAAPHALLPAAASARPLARVTALRVPADAFARVAAAHAADALANVAALHVRCVAGGVVAADVSLIVDVTVDGGGALRRRLYGCLPAVGEESVASGGGAAAVVSAPARDQNGW
jgi:hypothetical protein